MRDESLGTRLRRERERRQIALSTVAAQTKILPALLTGLERDDVSRWPCGIYRRSFVRAYAEAIGLDPDPVVNEFDERFPDPASPAPGPAGTPASLIDPHGSDESRPALRLTLADTPSPFRGGRLLSQHWRRWAAAACDTGVLLAIAAAFVFTLDDFRLPLSIAIATYFLGGILILGNTPGVWLCAPRAAHRDEPVVEPHEDAPRDASEPWRVFDHDAAWASSPANQRSHHRSSPS